MASCLCGVVLALGGLRLVLVITLLLGLPFHQLCPTKLLIRFQNQFNLFVFLVEEALKLLRLEDGLMGLTFLLSNVLLFGLLFFVFPPFVGSLGHLAVMVVLLDCWHCHLILLALPLFRGTPPFPLLRVIYEPRLPHLLPFFLQRSFFLQFLVLLIHNFLPLQSWHILHGHQSLIAGLPYRLHLIKLDFLEDINDIFLEGLECLRVEPGEAGDSIYSILPDIEVLVPREPDQLGQKKVSVRRKILFYLLVEDYDAFKELALAFDARMVEEFSQLLSHLG